MFIFEIIKAVFIGIIQGITEWLPVSSTGHMLLFDDIVKLNVTDEFRNMFMVVIQLGSILAVLVLYFHRLNPFSPKKSREEKQNTYSLWLKVIVAAIPAAIAGLLLDDWIDSLYVSDYSSFFIALALIFYGILFIVIENRNKKPTINSLGDLDYKTAFGIGIFQMLALIPGTSRSGSTILGASLLGTSRTVAAEFSFFLAVPMMFGASGMKLLKYFMKSGFGFTGEEWAILIVGTVVAFVVSVFAIRFLMDFIKKHDFKPFGWYRIILGIVVIIYFAVRLFSDNIQAIG